MRVGAQSEEDVYNPRHRSKTSPRLTSISPHSFVRLPSALLAFIAKGREGEEKEEDGEGEEEGGDGEMMERTGTKSSSSGGSERRRRQRASPSLGSRLMNVWRRVATPPPTPTPHPNDSPTPSPPPPVTEGSWLGAVIESKDN